MTTVSIRGRREDMDTETRPCEDVERDRTDGATRGHQKLGREGPPLGSDPQPFWHQGLDSRKTISPRTRVRGMVSGRPKSITYTLTSCSAAPFLTGLDRYQPVAQRLGTPAL